MASRRRGHAWHPIEDLSGELRSRRFPELDALLAVFERRRKELEQANVLQEFLARMVRSWSIETGILERLYTISESATLTLVEQGFDASLLSHDDTDLAPAQVIEILRDHEGAAEGLFQFVARNRARSKSYVLELHQVLTRHQVTCDAIDSQGKWVKVELRRGAWKLQPNNVGDPSTGEVWHQYCPPEQVESEMDRLIAMHREHEHVHYVVEAAWLHHRFAQIHPFQDGNGRVARALGSLVCIRGRGFPLVVNRSQKDAYIDALELADRGNLVPLVELFERQQRDAFMTAVGLSHEVLEKAKTVEAIVADARQRLQEALVERDEALTDRIGVLTQLTVTRLEGVATMLRESLGQQVGAAVFKSSSANQHWFKWQIAQTARKLGYYANFLGPTSWVHLRLTHNEITSLLISFHRLGRIEDGVVVAVALVSRRERDQDEDSARGHVFAIETACDEPISFTAGRDPGELRATYAAWLERSITIGLDIWRRSL